MSEGRGPASAAAAGRVALRLAAWIPAWLIVYLPLVVLAIAAIASIGRFDAAIAWDRVTALLVRSLAVSLSATLVALGLGLAGFLAIESLPGPVGLRRVVSLLALLAMFLPPYYQVAVWRPLFGDLPIRMASWRWPVCVALLGVAYAPLVAFFTSAGLRGVPRGVVEAARLGAPSWRSFYLRIILPLVRPSMLAAALLTLVLTFLNYEIGALLSLPLYPKEITAEYELTWSFGRATLFALPAFVVAAVGVLVWFRACDRQSWKPWTGEVASLPSRRWAAPAAIAWLVVVLGWPLGRLVDLSGGLHMARNVPDVLIAHGDELLWGVVVQLGSALLATGLAWLAVPRNGRPSRATLLWVGLPLAVPGTLLGAALIRIYNRPGGTLDFVYTTPAILVVAAVARFFPVGYLTLCLARRAVPQRLWEAADLSAPGPWTRFWQMSLPLASPGLALCAAVVLLCHGLEISASNLVAPPEFPQPVAVQVYSLLHYNTVLETPSLLCLLQFAGTVVLAAGFFGLYRVLALRRWSMMASRERSQP